MMPIHLGRGGNTKTHVHIGIMFVELHRRLGSLNNDDFPWFSFSSPMMRHAVWKAHVTIGKCWNTSKYLLITQERSIRIRLNKPPTVHAIPFHTSSALPLS